MMKHLLFWLIFLSFSPAFAATVYSEGTQMVRGVNKQFNYQSLRLGGSYSGNQWGSWGYGELLDGTLDSRVTYGEIAGIKGFSNDWAVNGAVGGGSNYRYKPSLFELVEVRKRINSLNLSPYLGFMQETYEAATPSIYDYYRLGTVFHLSSKYQLITQYQMIQNKLKGASGQRQGSGVLISFSQFSEKHIWDSAVMVSCLANSVACRGNRRDDYREVLSAFTYKWTNTWWFKIHASYIVQSSIFLAPFDPSLNTKTLDHSWFFKAGPIFNF